ncbi:MAG: 23S rRNA (adenine(1618)-N(6))-methyltransferase RlmF [Opitutaceae bacterium]|jgi:23S rRNA (adenine1618-N6)-methyltransferase
MSRATNTAAVEKSGLHPRNLHRHGYDFVQLVQASPELAAFVKQNPVGRDSIDFANPKAVQFLNRALLLHHYGIRFWELPAGYLCPPIPGRADYLHHMADLLGEKEAAGIPRGEKVRVLDVGVGASCVYPILGRHEYGWSFVGTDIDAEALHSARKIVAANPLLAGFVECRLQRSPQKIFQGIVKPGEHFAVSLCNPPFHSSSKSAAKGTLRKLRALAGRTLPRDTKAMLNFGGISTELVCQGGELGFVKRMIAESAEFPSLCGWFSCLISKSENLPGVLDALKSAKAAEFRTIPMAQGQKKSRIVAWKF